MEQLFGSIRSVLVELEPNDEAEGALVFAAWNQCAGELLRERTEPICFAAARLTVAVEDKTWQRHLEDLSPQMLVKLNRTLGQGRVRFIEFRIDEKTVSDARKVWVRAKPVAKSSILAPSLKRAASAIGDKHLRETFVNAAEAYLSNAKRNGKRM